MGSSLDRLAAQAAGDTTSTGAPQPDFDPSSALDRLAAQAERLASARRAMRRMLPPPDFSDVSGGSTTTAPTSEFGKLVREGEGVAGRIVKGIPGAVAGAVAAPFNSARAALFTPVQGETSPYSAMYAKAGPIAGLQAPGTTTTAANTPGAETTQQFQKGAAETLANAAAAPISMGVGGLAGRAGASALAARLLGNAAAGGVVGATYAPDGQRMKGAAVGAGLGAVIPEAVGAVTRAAQPVVSPLVQRFLPGQAAGADVAPRIQSVPGPTPQMLPEGNPMLLEPGPAERVSPTMRLQSGQAAPPFVGQARLQSPQGPTPRVLPAPVPPAGLLPRGPIRLGPGTPPAEPAPTAPAEPGTVPGVVADTVVARGLIDPALDFSRFGKPTPKIVLPPEVKAAIAAHPGPATTTPALDALTPKGFLSDESGSLNPAAVKATARTATQAVKGFASEAFPELDQPQDQPFRAALHEAGAAPQHGLNVAQYGMDYVEHGLPEQETALVQKQLIADNLRARAQRRAATGQTAAAARQTALADKIEAKLPKNLRQSPTYQEYVARYKQVVSPELERLATEGGLPEAKLLPIPDHSAYVPLPKSLEDGNIPKTTTIRPPGKARRATVKSGAAETAVGANEPLSIRGALQQVLPGRAKAAAVNNAYAALAKAGRPLAKGEALRPGEADVTFNDKGKIVQPDAEDATQRLAVPQRYADALKSSEQRRGPAPARGPFGKAKDAVVHGITHLETHLSPAITPVHGRNILLATGEEPSASTAANIAGVLPAADYAVGGARTARVNFNDPNTVKSLLSLSRYGGIRTPEATQNPFSRALFGPQGLDPRGRLAIAKAYQETHPDATPMEVTQHVTEALGNYVHANQPEGIRMAQGSGLTSFAPAAAAFTRGAVRRAIPVFPGQGGLGRRLAMAARTVGAPVATVEAANELLSGHSTLSNAKGHRADIDIGKTGREGGEEYIPLSGVAPLLSRVLNITDLRNVIEGETNPIEYLRRPANALLAHLGIGPRIGAAVLNVEPYITKAGVPATAAPVQMSQGRQLAQQAERGVGNVLGAGATAFGATSFSKDETPLQRVAGIFGIPVPYEDYQTAPGYKPKPTAYRDKESEGIAEVAKAAPQDRQAVIDRNVKAAESAGLPPAELRRYRAALLRERARAKQ